MVHASDFMRSSEEVKPAFTYKIANSITKALEKLVWAIDGSSSSKSVYLTGNFAPVDKEIHTDVEIIQGELPAGLNGAFVRNGPNPFYNPVGRYHWFDGDGCLHSVRIKDGKATYCNRWVETNRLKNEIKAGYPAGGKIGDDVGFTGLLHILLAQLKCKLGVLNNKDGLGTANTALAFHAGKLLALHEGDLPYSIRIACDGLVETIGRVTYGDKLDHAFTAHPKIDPVTQEMFFFGYSVETKPYLWYSRANAQGEVVADFPVPLPQPIMMHDFALSERYVIFFDVPLIFTPEAMVKENRLPFTFEKTRNTRFGVLDRYAEDASGIKWFDVEPCMIFHAANAFEEGDKINLFVCCFPDFSLDSFTAIKDSDPYLTRITLDMATGEAQKQRLSPVAGDFPVVPATLVGRKTRYSYLGAMETDCGGVPRFYGIAKIDLEAAGEKDSLQGLIRHGDGRLGGEAYFVPAPNATSEDDGYLMTYVYDEKTEDCQLVIYDAKSMSSAPVTVMKLPQRVPHGYHCTWVTESSMKEMNV